MFKIELTLNDGSPVKLYLTGKSNLAVCTDKGQTYVLDGLHGNGGWKVKETPAEVEAKLVAAGLCLADEADTAILYLDYIDAEGFAMEVGDEAFEKLLLADGEKVEIIGRGPYGYADIKLKDGTVIHSISNELLV